MKSPNIYSLGSKKLELYYGVVQSVKLNATPIWHEVMFVKKYVCKYNEDVIKSYPSESNERFSH